MTNSNGHSSPAVVAANRTVEACRKRLQQIDDKLTALRTRLATAQAAATLAQQRLQQAEQAMADGAAGADREWQAARASAEQEQAKVRTLQGNVTQQEQLRTLPEAEYQAASVVLATAIEDEDIQRLERATATSKHRLGQLQDALLLEEQEYSKLANQLRTRTLRRQEAQRVANERAGQAAYRAANPDWRRDSNVVTRQGF
jgi:chromosome segregation ATPase